MPTFHIGSSSFNREEWEPLALVQGRQAWRSVYEFGDGATAGNKILIPFRSSATQTIPFVFQPGPGQLAAFNIWRANPSAWDTWQVANIAANAAHGSFFHSVVSSVGNALSDVVEFGLEIDQAALHPLTINSNGLALSNPAIGLVPDNLQGIVQTAVSIAGYATLAAAGVTAIGGIGAAVDAVQGAAGIVSGAAGAVSGATSLVAGVQSAGAALGLFGGAAPQLVSNNTAQQAANLPQPSNGMGIALVALALVVVLGARR